MQFLIDDKKFSGFLNLFHAVLIDDIFFSDLIYIFFRYLLNYSNQKAL